jgi:hypothetical protein
MAGKERETGPDDVKEMDKLCTEQERAAYHEAGHAVG